MFSPFPSCGPSQYPAFASVSHPINNIVAVEELIMSMPMETTDTPPIEGYYSI